MDAKERLERPEKIKGYSMICKFTFVCNGEPPVTTGDVTVGVNTMGANVINSIESALRGQHQRMKPGSYLEITSITCQGLTSEYGDTNLYNAPLMKFADSGDVYHFTIIGNYDFKPIEVGGRRRSRKSRKSRKSRRR